MHAAGYVPDCEQHAADRSKYSLFANGTTILISHLQSNLFERFSVGFGMPFVLAQGKSVKGS
jgi:hypothetical protein